MQKLRSSWEDDNLPYGKELLLTRRQLLICTWIVRASKQMDQHPDIFLRLLCLLWY